MKDLESYAVVIPARYQSSRFPGKPLIDLCGKTMIQHVWERCCMAVGRDKVYVATDDHRIELAVDAFGGQVVRTSSDCITGTDRLAEANRSLNCDFIINVQGDEPLVSHLDIIKVMNRFKETGNISNAMCMLTSEEEFYSWNIPKVVFSKSRRLLYMSRSGIPLKKNGEYVFGYKQVCIYAFSKKQLEFFSRLSEKSSCEAVEDIEILRFLESDFIIDMVEVDSGSVAIDVPADVARVEMVMNTLSV